MNTKILLTYITTYITYIIQFCIPPSQLTVFVYEETAVWCFIRLSTKVCFSNYLCAWWSAMFYTFLWLCILDVFLWLNFVWMNICLFFQLLSPIIVIVYARDFKGQLEILTLTSWCQHLHCKILFFFSKIFWTIKHDQYNYSCAHFFGTNIILLQLLISLWSSVHPSSGNHWCCSKNFVWIFGVLIY